MEAETKTEQEERQGGAEFGSLRVDPMAATEEEEGSRKDEEEEEERKKKRKKAVSPPTRPTLTLPPRTSPFGFLTDASPGPMTLVSNLFPEYSDSACPSFSELLIGAMASPAATAGIGRRTAAVAGGENSNNNSGGGGSEDKESGRSELPSPFFTIPPGILDSPNFFSPAQGSYGISHQQALAQVTAQAAWSNSHANVQVNYPPISSAVTASTIPPSSSAASTIQQMPTQVSEGRYANVPQADTKSQSTSLTVDKPTDDGYNWRKYGQKQVKGSEFPRSYYRCTHPDCLVKKKVERSLDGQVTEIIYKGQHNHGQPAPGKRAKETLPRESNGILDPDEKSQSRNLIRTAESHKRDRESGQTAIEHLPGSSDEDVGDAEVGANDRDEDVHDPRKRNLDAGVTKSGTLHKTVTEPRVIVQTQSEVDLLDDGYRWRKYGQKVVKGNPNPRSYYKCTYAGCTVRKHVERASTDAASVITTYEGKHNHDVPAARKSSHSMTNDGAAFNVLQSKAYNPANNHTLPARTEYSSDQHPAAVLRLKEEET